MNDAARTKWCRKWLMWPAVVAAVIVGLVALGLVNSDGSLLPSTRSSKSYAAEAGKFKALLPPKPDEGDIWKLEIQNNGGRWAWLYIIRFVPPPSGKSMCSPGVEIRANDVLLIPWDDIIRNYRWSMVFRSDDGVLLAKIKSVDLEIVEPDDDNEPKP